jgi:hypothetical protein
MQFPAKLSHSFIIDERRVCGRRRVLKDDTRSRINAAYIVSIIEGTVVVQVKHRSIKAD